MIAIIDYGMGNLRSVQKAFEAAGREAVVTREPRVIGDASHVVLPGVGAFGDCMANLERYGLIEPVHRAVRSGKPFMGICLGLQLLFTESEEFGVHKGLDIVPGRVRRFPLSLPPAPGSSAAARLKVPHMGWNGVAIMREAPPLRGIPTGAHLYFVHSYYVEPGEAGIACSTTDYGLSFVSSIWRDNVFACQFHPEKSQTIGLRIIQNFAVWQ